METLGSLRELLVGGMFDISDNLSQTGEHLGGIEQDICILLIQDQGIFMGLQCGLQGLKLGCLQLRGQFGMLGDFILNPGPASG